MSVVKSCIKICLLSVLSCTSILGHAATGDTPPERPLSPLLQLSQTRLQASQLNSTTLNDERALELSASSWLSGLPSISLSHLGSLDNGNSYEQEVSLNLPLKSPGQHGSDKRLTQLSQAIQSQQSALQSLYLSGLLRQSLWAHRIASVKLKQLARKTNLLQKLHTQQKRLTDVGELPLANLLLLERELVDIELEQIDIQQQQDEAHALYRQLTGQDEVPTQIAESQRPLANGNSDLAQHPLWQLQTLQQQQQLLIIKSQQAGEQDPWTVSLTAKNTSDDQVDDQQLGLGITVPLGFSSALSQGELSQWQQAHTEQNLARDRTYLELTTQINKLTQQQGNLQQQHALLSRGLSLSRTITEELAKVKDQDQVSYEIWLRRYVDALDTESRLTLNQVMQQQLHSQQLQALGISL